MAQAESEYPLQFSVDYPDRPLNRLTTGFRVLTAIPIAVVLYAIVAGGSSVLFFPVLLLIVFRQKYPRWWFDWNLALMRFQSRFSAYALLLTDEYPSTEDEQSVHLEFLYPDVETDLNRWMPLVKWLLAVPHYIVLAVLGNVAVVVVVIAWFAILFTGRYPKDLFDFMVGVLRYVSRVAVYAFVLTTDRYPPFRLGA